MPIAHAKTDLGMSLATRRDSLPVATMSSTDVDLDNYLSEPAEEKDIDPAPVGGDVNDTVPVYVERLSNTRIFLLAVAMMTTYFLGTTCSTSSTIMIPSIAADFGVSELDVQWVVAAYTLAYGCGLLFSGRLADMYGRKLLFIGGLAIFAITSIISAVLKNRIALYVFRAFSGLGLAIASPAVYGIAGTSVRHEPARTFVFAALGLGGPVGACAGTMIGGAISNTSAHGWSYLFYVLAGGSMVPLILGIFVVPRDQRILKHRHLKYIDWLGGFLVTASTSIFLFSLTQSGIVPDGWATPYVPALLVVSIILGVCFIFWERHLERNCALPPIIKPSLFTRRRYKALAVVLCAFFACEPVVGFTYLTSILYQNVMGLSPLANAIRILPANINGFLAGASVLLLVPRVRAPYLFAFGGFMTGVCHILYAVEPEGTNYWACQFIACLCLPYGIDFVVGVGSILMSNLVDDDEQSVGGAAFQTFAQLGGAMGTTLSSLVSTSIAQRSGDLHTGLRAANWLNMALSWTVILITYVFLRRVRLAKDVRHVP